MGPRHSRLAPLRSRVRRSVKNPIAPVGIPSPVRGVEQPARRELHEHSRASDQFDERPRTWVQEGDYKRPTEVGSNLEFGGDRRNSRSHLVFDLSRFVPTAGSATISLTSVPNVEPPSRNVRWSITASGLLMAAIHGCRNMRGFARIRSGTFTNVPGTGVDSFASPMDWVAAYAAQRRSAIKPTTG